MPYELDWYIPGMVLYARFVGTMSPNEMMDYNTQVLDALGREGGDYVHFLIDSRHVATFPLAPQEAAEAMYHLQHPNVGWVVVFGAGRIEQFIESMVSQMLGVRLRHCEVVDEAREFLMSVDDQLDWANAQDSLLYD